VKTIFWSDAVIQKNSPIRYGTVSGCWGSDSRVNCHGV
jgi:hypothetical protein